MALSVGDKLGRYEILAPLGAGGMGEVYRARDPLLDRQVAVKVLPPHLAGDEVAKERLRREALAAAALDHPFICKVFEIGETDGALFIVMEHVSGVTLRAQLATARIPLSDALRIAGEMAEALEEAHARHIVHRDLKPANIMLTPQGRVKVMDFGLAKRSGLEVGDPTITALTQKGAIVGTPNYMSPEQVKGEPADTRSDLFSFGIVLCELLGGDNPFHRETTFETVAAILHDPPQLPERLPQGLILVIRRLLAKAPAQRYQSMKEVRTDLTQVTAASATEGRPAGSRLIWSDSEAATEALSGAQPLVARIGYPRRRWLWAAAGVLAAALAGTAVWGLWSRKAPVAASLSGDDYLKATGLLDNSYRPNAVPAAQALLEKRLAADPEFALGHAALGRAYWLSYRANGDTALVDKAKRACARALQLDRNLAPPHVTLGRIYTETGQTDLATEEIQKALKLDPRSAEAYGAQAELFQKQGRNAEAEPLLEMAADLAPDDWRWPNLLALHYRNTGRLTESVKQFERLAQLTPENVSAFINLGNSYLRMEKFPEAQVAYEKSFQLQRRPQALAGLGSVLLIQGKWQEAAERFRESIDLNPSDHLGWGNLAAAYTWGQAANKAGDAYRKAIDLAEQNRVARPKDAGLLAILGGYYAATKNGQKSRRLLRQAAALDPENAEVRYRVGEGYETLGDRPQALRHLRKALSLGHSLAWVRRSPEFRQLRADPEFLSILPKAIK